MDTAQRFIQYLRDNHDDPLALRVFDYFQDRTEQFRVTSRDPRGFQCVSRVDFRDWSHVEISLTSSEDHLAFVAWGRYDENAAVFHPEGVGAEMFRLVDQLHGGGTPGTA